MSSKCFDSNRSVFKGWFFIAKQRSSFANDLPFTPHFKMFSVILVTPTPTLFNANPKIQKKASPF